MPDAFAPSDIDMSSAYSSPTGAQTITMPGATAPAGNANPTGDLNGILAELGAILQENNLFADFTPTPGLASVPVDVTTILSPEALATLSDDEKNQIAQFLQNRQDPNVQRQSAYERAQQLLTHLGFAGSIQDFMGLDRTGIQNLATNWLAKNGRTSALGQPSTYQGPVNVVQSGPSARSQVASPPPAVGGEPGPGPVEQAPTPQVAQPNAVQTPDAASAAIEAWRQAMIASSRAPVQQPGTRNTSTNVYVNPAVAPKPSSTVVRQPAPTTTSGSTGTTKAIAGKIVQS